MFFTVLSATILSATLAQAEIAYQLGGPANFPPAGFTGQQFVDNRGCVFMKAGFGGTVNWVPRVTATHKPLCGYPPTFGAAVQTAVAADMAPEVAAAQITVAPQQSASAMLLGQPIPLVPVASVVMAAPVTGPAAKLPTVMVAAQPSYVTAPNGTQAQCFTGSPQLETVLLRSGGTALVCTTGDGTLNGWRAPLFPQGIVGGALTSGMMLGASLTVYAAAQPSFAAAQPANAIPTPPKGYKLAWKDDRLNPMRGIGTTSGQAQQDQIWTRAVPARLVTAPQIAQQTATTSVSTMSASSNQRLANQSLANQSLANQSLANQSLTYVQVGTFGQPANATGAKARLAALGLPVSTSQITRKGRILQIVFAGPFATTAQAYSALTATKAAGFNDAILR